MPEPWGRAVPDRTSYVCGSFAIDRFGALASQTAASIRDNRRVAAADAWRAAFGPRSLSRVDLPSSAHVGRPDGSENTGPSLQRAPDGGDPLTVGMAHPDAAVALLSGSGGITAHFSSPPFLQRELRSPQLHSILSTYDVLGGDRKSTRLNSSHSSISYAVF